MNNEIFSLNVHDFFSVLFYINICTGSILILKFYFLNFAYILKHRKNGDASNSFALSICPCRWLPFSICLDFSEFCCFSDLLCFGSNATDERLLLEMYIYHTIFSIFIQHWFCCIFILSKVLGCCFNAIDIKIEKFIRYRII